MKRKISILYTAAGGGHLAAAKALKAVLENSGRYEVSLVNPYREIIDELDFFKSTSYENGEEVYNKFIQEKGHTGFLCLLFYGIVIGSTYLRRKKGIKLFEEHWEATKPDLIISVMPMLNTGIVWTLEHFEIPFMVLMTDLREPSKYTWFPKSNEPTVLCGTKDAYEDGLKKPHPKENTHLLSGLVVNPSFYDQEPIDIKKERVVSGLKENVITACILYGGSGSHRMVELAKVLQDTHSFDKEFQIIFLCGRSQDVAQKIKALQLPFPHIIVGYTDKIPYYIQLADFMIGKPGPGFISESLVMKRPLLIDRKNVLLQERYNIQWLDTHNMGSSFKSLRSFKKEFNDLLDSDKLNLIQQEVNKHSNQAVFEVLPIVDSVMEKHYLVKE